MTEIWVVFDKIIYQVNYWITKLLQVEKVKTINRNRVILLSLLNIVELIIKKLLYNRIILKISKNTRISELDVMPPTWIWLETYTETSLILGLDTKNSRCKQFWASSMTKTILPNSGIKYLFSRPNEQNTRCDSAIRVFPGSGKWTLMSALKALSTGIRTRNLLFSQIAKQNVQLSNCAPYIPICNWQLTYFIHNSKLWIKWEIFTYKSSLKILPKNQEILTY